MTKTFFTSDLHFYHKNIVKFTNRGVDTTQEDHDEWLKNRWNSQVSKGDLVWHLGDFSFSHDFEATVALLRQLNGVKHFIKGNHDSRRVMEDLVKEKVLHWFGDYKEIKIGRESVILNHYPYAVWHKQHYGAWHLHGHSHGNYVIQKGKILDVGLDSAYNLFGQHRFFTEEDIEQYMKYRSMEILDHHVDRTKEM
jgi:calcineurin-like phosphoesterase family protein